MSQVSDSQNNKRPKFTRAKAMTLPIKDTNLVT